VAEVGQIRFLEFAELRGDPVRNDECLVVAGKCLAGPIRVGDRFSRLVDSSGVEYDVDIGVIDIGFYGGFVLELEPALAGELILVGELKPELLVGATLRGCAVEEADV
jgi:hypothetical protein